jgi:hypothetical protein
VTLRLKELPEKSCPRHRNSYLESKASTWEPEMEDQIQTSAVIDRAIEIFRPATDHSCFSERVPACVADTMPDG